MTEQQKRQYALVGLMLAVLLMTVLFVTGCNKGDETASSTGGPTAVAPPGGPGGAPAIAPMGPGMAPGGAGGIPPMGPGMAPGAAPGGMMPGGMSMPGAAPSAPGAGPSAGAPTLGGPNSAPIETSRRDPFAPFAMTRVPKIDPTLWYMSHRMDSPQRYSGTIRPSLPEQGAAPNARVAGLIWGGKDYAILERVAADGSTESLVLRPGDIIDNEELIAITPSQATLRDMKTKEIRRIPIMSLEEWQSLRRSAGTGGGTMGGFNMPMMGGGMMPGPTMMPGAGAPGMAGGFPMPGMGNMPGIR